MGIEYALVNDDEKTYIHMGKRCRDYKESSDGEVEAIPIGFQMHDEVIARFVCGADPGDRLRVVADSGDEYDELYEKGYTMVDEWCGDFASRRKVGSGEVDRLTAEVDALTSLLVVPADGPWDGKWLITVADAGLHWMPAMPGVCGTREEAVRAVRRAAGIEDNNGETIATS